MADQLQIKDLLLRTIIGINEEERLNRQDVLINLTLYTDTRAPGASDDADLAVNYRTITKRVIQRVEDSSFRLVERLAAEIAAICLEDSRVEAVDVRVEKPGALRFARSVGVEIRRTRSGAEVQVNRALVAMGSNIDSERNLRDAVQMLSRRCRLLAVSTVYETEPVGNSDQPTFLNAAALIETDRTAQDLKAEVLQAIEQALGRVRTADKNAPRTIDLDIALFGEQVLDLGPRHIPDPDILKHAHVAVPLADVAPEWRHPETGQTLQEIARSLLVGGLVCRRDVALWPQTLEPCREESEHD
jgi:dihydroneopterin aldolase/2-amino-4-hydroxy-6-hydroxymethyldihydropteridine diphosphokinase